MHNNELSRIKDDHLIGNSNQDIEQNDQKARFKRGMKRNAK